MKFAIPQSPPAFFEKTEFAVRHAYSGLASCCAYWQQALQYEAPWQHGDHGMMYRDPPKTPEEKARSERFLELADKYMSLKPSEAMLAGSILQTAYTGIRIFSKNQVVPSIYAGLVQNSTARQFCVGKDRYGIPTGLIIYAGRNQFCHWDEAEAAHENTATIFRALTIAFWDNPFSDLAFDLGNPTISIYAGEVLFTALGWASYDKYISEMTELLGSC